MSLSSKQLEQEIAAMEGRLATVKVTVEIEKNAWKKVARKGKQGTKWKSAASSSNSSNNNNISIGIGSGKATATASLALTTGRSEIENADGEIVIEPMQWDSLELAQFLQSKQLAAYAQIVVYEQITGKLLLETPPGKLKKLFQDLVASGTKNDPNWDLFLRVCSEMHTLHKTMNVPASKKKSNCDTDFVPEGEKNRHRKAEPSPQRHPLFPAISPRMPAIKASSLVTKGTKPSAPPSSASANLIVGSDGPSKRLKTPAQHGGSLRKPVANTTAQPKATCWNCGARFPRPPVSVPSSGIAKQAAAGQPLVQLRLFCSTICQQTIESSEMSVAPTLSLGVRQPSTRELQGQNQAHSTPQETVSSSHGHVVPRPPPPHAAPQLATVIKSPRHRPQGTPDSDTFDFLHVARRGPPPVQTPTPLPDAARVVIAAQRQAGGGKRFVPPSNYEQLHVGGGLTTSTASITAVRYLSEDALPASLLRPPPPNERPMHQDPGRHHQPRMMAQSQYKLDPGMFHKHTGVSWATCFDATSVQHAPDSHHGNTSDTRATNLAIVATFLSCKAVYHLSLTCHKWFELVHVHPLSADRVWAVLCQRTWLQRPEDDECLRTLGFLKRKTKKPRRMMMKMTRQVHKTVLDGMKILLHPENWQLAPVCKQEIEYIPVSYTRRSTVHDGTLYPLLAAPSEPIDRGNDLYEVITVIVTPACEIVAVQAQELIRPIAEDGSTMEILQGLKTGALLRVQCRRLRLFSLTNRLGFHDWYLLPDIAALLEFCMVPRSDADRLQEPSIWHIKVLTRLQTQLEKRMLSKESIQQIMKLTQERNASQQAMDALEQFLLRHAPALLSHSTGNTRAK